MQGHKIPKARSGGLEPKAGAAKRCMECMVRIHTEIRTEDCRILRAQNATQQATVKFG